MPQPIPPKRMAIRFRERNNQRGRGGGALIFSAILRDEWSEQANQRKPVNGKSQAQRRQDSQLKTDITETCTNKN